MHTTISFLTQDETTRLFAAPPCHRDRVPFLPASRHGYRHGCSHTVSTPQCPKGEGGGPARLYRGEDWWAGYRPVAV